MSIQEQHQQQQQQEYCDICRKSSGYDIKIRRLFNGRQMILVDSESGHRHLHYYNQEHWDWEHFENNGGIGHWKKKY